MWGKREGDRPGRPEERKARKMGDKRLQREGEKHKWRERGNERNMWWRAKGGRLSGIWVRGRPGGEGEMRKAKPLGCILSVNSADGPQEGVRTTVQKSRSSKKVAKTRSEINSTRLGYMGANGNSSETEPPSPGHAEVDLG